MNYKSDPLVCTGNLCALEVTHLRTFSLMLYIPTNFS